MSWLSIAGAGCDLIGVGAGEEQLRKVYVRGPPGVEQTCGPGLRGWVAGRTHDGKNNKTKSCTVPFLILKAMIEPGRRGGHVMSGDWQEATPSLLCFQRFTTNPLG
jgi:hypothetical protein